VILKREKEILGKQVKLLKKTLRDLDFKYSTFVANCKSMNAQSTHLEFEEVDIDEILKLATEQDEGEHTEVEEFSYISEDSVNYVDMPLDTEVMNGASAYANEVRESIVDDA
jgi:uncharacterized protein YaaQ